ncbi:hypothetical protein EW145_g699 [Phellinidium pouzarii]|uniref:Uncharacterized protein n=1 Tax=Phellinidium pouzarii TaxID=167371 RepID=A0A4S4LHL2_9AGAM|nr:hypothetical protein EW145_g699 [Phellinidium pouzarii]
MALHHKESSNLPISEEANLDGSRLSSPPPYDAPEPDDLQHQEDPHRAYAELLSCYRQQQQALIRLRAANVERSHSSERLGADLLAMTHRYLQAQAHVKDLETRCEEAETRAENLASQLEHEKKREGLETYPKQLDEEKRVLRMPYVEKEDTQEEEQKEWDPTCDDVGDIIIIASAANSSDNVDASIPLSPPRAQVSSEELVKLVKSINVQSLEIARACIASSTFRGGVKVPQVDNKMIVNVTEGIGCVLVQMLRAKDHSRDKALVELAVQTLLAYHVFKIMESWPFHAQLEDDKSSPKNSQGKESQLQLQRNKYALLAYKSNFPDADLDSQSENSTKRGFSKVVESAIVNVVTILSLCGSPGHASALRRNHEARIGSTIDALFKATEQLAGHVKGRSIGTSEFSFAEYKLLYAKPGSVFNKDIMQRQGPQPAMVKWKSSGKKNAQVLGTKEIGLACMHRSASVTGSSLSRADSGSSGRSSSKELEVLTKATIVFESEVDK